MECHLLWRLLFLYDNTIILHSPLQDAVGYTPLQRAARSDHHEVVRLMLEAGAGLYSIGPEGHNAVQIAVSCDSLQ